MEEKKHIFYFDYLRIIAAVGVVYMHVAALPLREPISADWHIMNAFTCLAFCAVPLFFMMSGFLLISSEKSTDISHLLRKRLPRLVIPLAGWTVAAAAVTCYVNESRNPADFFKIIVDALNKPAAAHLWYMYTLIAVYAISPVICAGIRSMNKRGRIYVLAIIAAVSLRAIITAFLPASLDKYLQIDIIAKMEFFGGHLCTFVLGYFLGTMKRKIPNWILACASAVLLGTVICGTYVMTVQSGSFNQTFQGQSAGFEVLLAACIFLLFKQNFNRTAAWLNTLLRPLVSLSLSVYLMHNILLSLFYHFNIYPHTFLSTAKVTLLNLVICIFVLKTAATVKPVCYLFTGMPYSEACRTCNWVYTFRNIKKLFSRKTPPEKTE